MIRAVVFDLDGTLIDSIDAHAISWITAYRLLGYGNVPISEVKKYIGVRGDLITEKVLGGNALKDYGKIRILKDRVFLKLARDGVVSVYPDTHHVLRVLKDRGLKLCLATSTNIPTLLPILEHFKLVDFFDAVVAGEEVLRSKPEPDLFLEALRRVGVDPNDSLVVGDTLYDVIPSKKIGAVSVLLVRPGNDASMIREHAMPDYVINDLRGLIDIAFR